MNLHIADRPAEPTARLFDVAELVRMIEAGIIAPDEKVELLEGELVWMAATKFPHQGLNVRLAAWFTRALDETFYVGSTGSLRLGPETLVEPDILITRWQDARISPEGFLELAPADLLLIVEISDTTLPFDLARKARLYARHGVADYWVVDAKTRETHVHRGPGPDGYASVTLIPPTEAAAPLAPALAPIMRPLATLA
jgi:Uma2 family endonuclease